MRHMLQGAREGASDAGQSVSRGADRPPAARAGAERADGRELHPAQWDLPPHVLSVAQEVRRPHRDRGHPAQAPGARECPLEGAARRSGARAAGAERDQRKKMERVAVRRAQVRYAMTRHLSCRRACTLLRVARSALGYAARRPGRDAALVAALQCLAAAHPRYGYRRMWALLRRRGLAVTTTAYIDPGKPWQNGVGESFHSRFRDECLNQEAFFTVREAAVLIEQSRRTYNEARPHSSLRYHTPTEVATRRARPHREP